MLPLVIESGSQKNIAMKNTENIENTDNTENKRTLIVPIKRVGCFVKYMPVIAAVVMAGFVLPAYAESRFTLPYVGGNLGAAKVQRPSGYDNSGSQNAYGGFYLFHDLSLELWMANLGQFDVNGLNNSYSESSGMGATLAYRFDMGRLFALRPSIGLLYSQTEITFEGQKIGEDSGSDLMFGLSAVFTIKEHWLVNINSHLFKDVSGADITVLSVGGGYQF
jgi:hypothetical protein